MTAANRGEKWLICFRFSRAWSVRLSNGRIQTVLQDASNRALNPLIQWITMLPCKTHGKVSQNSPHGAGRLKSC